MLRVGRSGWTNHIKEVAMQASIGDKIVVHSRRVGEPGRQGVITGLRRPDGSPPYVVLWDDGHEVVFYPSADCTISRPGPEHPAHDGVRQSA
jgi:hypothetical protein